MPMPSRPNRRTMLKGLLYGGLTTVALPTLEMFLNPNATAFADGSPLPTRFVLGFWGNGVRLSQWVPTMTGAGYTLSPALTPYAAVQNDMTLITGTICKIGGFVHHYGCAGMLSAADYVYSGTSTITTLGAPTFDQVVAGYIGTSTRFKSLQIGVLNPTKSDEGTTLQYLSHNGPNNVNPAQYSPSALFQQLFGAGTLSSAYGSVLDTVLADINALNNRVSSADKQRLDAYYTNVRSIETGLQSNGQACTSAVDPGVDSPTLTSVAQITARSNAMWQLMSAALACDLTRVVSVHYCGASQCIQVPPEVFAGVSLYEGGSTPIANDSTHGMTHEESTYDQPVVQKWSQFYQTQFANMLQTMKNTSDGSGTLLDNSAVMLTTEVSQGRNHVNRHMPIILAGRARGKLLTGFHFAGNVATQSTSPQKAPAILYDANGDIITDTSQGAQPDSAFINATNVHLTIMRALGINQTSYGSGGAATSTIIPQLLA